MHTASTPLALSMHTGCLVERGYAYTFCHSHRWSCKHYVSARKTRMLTPRAEQRGQTPSPSEQGSSLEALDRLLGVREAVRAEPGAQGRSMLVVAYDDTRCCRLLASCCIYYSSKRLRSWQGHLRHQAGRLVQRAGGTLTHALDMMSVRLALQAVPAQYLTEKCC